MLKILTSIYAFVIKLKNLLYRKEILKIKKINETEVICIGNITVGGTGKTPAVQYFANEFITAGKKVAIVSRGYKGKRKIDPLIVRDLDNILATEDESGDEAFLHALVLGIPIVVGKNRYEACKIAKEQFNVEVIILDDGYQHRKLYRDKNILLIDATNPFGGGKLLPEGRLREPISEIGRAAEIIITKTDLVRKEKLEETINKLRKYNKKIRLSQHKPIYFYDANKKRYNFDIVKKQKLLLVSGIANPENFEKTVLRYNPESIKRVDFSDHSEYGEKEIKRIDEQLRLNNIDYIVTTEKDFMKLQKITKLKKLLVLKIEFNIIGEIE